VAEVGIHGSHECQSSSALVPIQRIKARNASEEPPFEASTQGTTFGRHFEELDSPVTVIDASPDQSNSSRGTLEVEGNGSRRRSRGVLLNYDLHSLNAVI
jgi:hypothetical protein